MTNADRYKTAYERLKAHREMCRRKNNCNCIGDSLCLLKWLEQEVEEKLLPCPFCGGTETTRIEKDNIGCFRVECQNLKCEMNPKTPWCDIVESAIGMWNRRAQ